MKHPLSDEAFLDWLERQPKDATFNFTDNHNCAYNQYLRQAGFDVFSVGAYGWHDETNWEEHRIPKKSATALVKVGCRKPYETKFSEVSKELRYALSQ